MKLTGIREKILIGTIQVFNKKGLKLTMDDVADELKISKKTIYKEFTSKEEMFETMADYVFDNIKVREEEILATEEFHILLINQNFRLMRKRSECFCRRCLKDTGTSTSRNSIR